MLADTILTEIYMKFVWDEFSEQHQHQSTILMHNTYLYLVQIKYKSNAHPLASEDNIFIGKNRHIL